MSTPSRSVSRYQRRILAWGGGVACLLYVVGAPFYLDRVEADLSDRVTDELVEAGFDGVQVSFSGQTGSIACTEPLGDPRAALDLAYSVRGVRSVSDLPDECRVRVPDDDTDRENTTSQAPATTAAPTVSDDGGVGSTSTTTSVPSADFATVLDVLDGSPQFSLLRQLVQDAGLDGELAGEGPVTVFAPTNSAFDELSADAVAQLRSEPELLARVLVHHLVAARLPLDELTPGLLTTVADDELELVATRSGLTVDGGAVVDADVLAGNGVVHAVDALLLPDDVDLTVPDQPASATAAFVDGAITLDGVVRSEVERSILTAAAVAAVGADAVVDQLAVAPELGLDESTAQSLASLVTVVADSLVDGTASFDGTSLVVTGTYTAEAARDAVETVASTVGAEATLTERPPASVDDAVDLETELNELVVANPILFEPSSSVLDGSATPIIDEIARRMSEVPGVAITIEGHTDSDGGAEENLVLSQLRAVAVRDALVERGVDPDSVSAEGLGSTQPVLVDGVEDKAASRRVEFRVEVA